MDMKQAGSPVDPYRANEVVKHQMDAFQRAQDAIATERAKRRQITLTFQSFAA